MPISILGLIVMSLTCINVIVSVFRWCSDNTGGWCASSCGWLCVLIFEVTYYVNAEVL
jgi:hypothetical protein